MKTLVILCLLVLMILDDVIKPKRTLRDERIYTLIMIFLIALAFSPYIFLSPAVSIITVFTIYPIFRYLIKTVRNFIYKLDAYDDLQTLNREINVKYNPSITSMLINGKVDEKSLIADIMNLYAMKIIDLEKSSDNNKEKNIFKINKENIKKTKIFKSDVYIIDSIILNKKKFNFSEWEKLVENTFSKIGVQNLNVKEISFINLIFPLIIIWLITFFVLMLYFHDLLVFTAFILSIFWMCFCLIPVFYIVQFLNSKPVQKLHLTKAGKREVKNWIKFENFIKKYTLIKEKNVEDIVIYEKYIPYAVVLGINLNYKDTMYSVFDDLEIKQILNDIRNKDEYEDIRNIDLIE